MYIIENGWVKGIRRCLSPNYDTRPDGQTISLLVVHSISLPPGEYGGEDIELFFCNRLDTSKHDFYDEIKQLKVSAHFLIRRSGELVQFVNIYDRAWHAGVSCYQGKSKCNDFSVGVELEGCDDEPFTDRQYQVLNRLVDALVATCPDLSYKRMVGHNEIAPGRKTDPGPFFDWKKTARPPIE